MKLGRVWVLLIAVLMASVFSSCYFFPKEEEVLAPPIKEPEKVNFETIQVKTGIIERNIRCTGTFVSVSQIDLYYKDRGGRLENLAVKLGDKVKKGRLIAQLETDAVENDMQLQEIALKRAQIVYDGIKTRHEIDGGGDKFELELAQLDVDSNQIRLNSLRTELERSKIFSPIDGEVVYATDTKLGDNINGHQTVARIADPSKLQIEYTDDNALNFKTGMKPELTWDGKTYIGEVIMTPGDLPADASEVAKKSIRIKVNGLPGDISIGSTIPVKLTLEKHENVIVLPKQVVNSFSSRRFVNVLRNGIREEQDVGVGIQNDTDVEVVSGLNVGDLVIVR